MHLEKVCTWETVHLERGQFSLRLNCNDTVQDLGQLKVLRRLRTVVHSCERPSATSKTSKIKQQYLRTQITRPAQPYIQVLCTDLQKHFNGAVQQWPYNSKSLGFGHKQAINDHSTRDRTTCKTSKTISNYKMQPHIKVSCPALQNAKAIKVRFKQWLEFLGTLTIISYFTQVFGCI